MLAEIGLPDGLGESPHSPGVDEGLVVHEEDEPLLDGTQLLDDGVDLAPEIVSVHDPPDRAEATAKRTPDCHSQRRDRAHPVDVVAVTVAGRQGAVGLRKGVELDRILFATENETGLRAGPNARNAARCRTASERREDGAERPNPFARHDEVDLGFVKVDGLEGGVMSPRDGPARGEDCLEAPADLEIAKDEHRVAGDSGGLGLKVPEGRLEIVGVEPQIENPDFVPVQPGSSADVLERDGFRDGSQISPADDFLAGVRVDEQDAHPGYLLPLREPGGGQAPRDHPSPSLRGF